MLSLLRQGALQKDQFLNFSRHLTTLAPTIREILSNPPTNDSLLSARGHIKSIRHFKNIGFLDLSDGSTHKSLSIVFKNPEQVLTEQNFKVGQSLTVIGNWRESQGIQDFELMYDSESPEHELSIIGSVSDTYPIQKKSLTYQFLRNLPTLRHRTSTLASILRLRSSAETKLNEFFNEQKFVKVSPPLITSTDCEGAGEQFKVDILNEVPNKTPKNPEDNFFGKETYLTVSTQLHLETLAMSLNRVWTLSPCFRAEESNTNRHLSEFWMLEAEICYVDDVKQLTAFAESMIRYVVRSLQKDTQPNSIGDYNDLLASRYDKDEKDIIQNRWKALMSDQEWPRITYTEAIDVINRVKNKGRLKGRLIWGDSIQTEHEKWLAGDHFGCPVFITDYPRFQKPFYMPASHVKVYDQERPTVACFDLIVPGIGELIGGSMREHRYKNLVHEMNQRSMNVEDMEWYISTRLDGTVPHGGFGMGFERLISYLGAMDNVKDVIPYPRTPNLCQC